MNHLAQASSLSIIGRSGPGGVPLPTLAMVSRSAHGSARCCVPCSLVLGAGLPCRGGDAALRARRCYEHHGVSCSPRPILVTGSAGPECLLIQQLGRSARLLDSDVQPPACLGDLVRLGAQVGHLDGRNLLQFTAQLPTPADSVANAAGPGVGDRRHQPVLGRVPVAHGQRVGEGEARVQLGRAVRPVDPHGQIPQLADEPPSLVQELDRVLRRLLAFLVAGYRGGPRLNLVQLLLLASPIGQRLAK
jgi:hypothetical protein